MSETDTEIVEVGSTIDDYDEPAEVTLITTEIDDTTDGTDGVLFQTDGPITVEVGQSAGNRCWAEVEYFIALETEYELDEMQQNIMAMQQGVEPEEIDSEVEEASVFISNEDGDIGAGLIREEGGTANGVLAEFADSIEDGELNIDFEEEDLEDAEIAAE
jgi:hypothetical protein